MRYVLAMLVVCSQAFAAGPVIVGGRGGAALSDSSDFGFGTNNVDAPGYNFAVGPTLGVRLPLGFSVEGDALYNRQTLGLGLLGLDTHQDWWEFPVMAKWTAGRGAIAPVLGAGVSVRHIRDFGDVPSYLFSRSTESTSVGFVAGGGIRFQAGPVAITPEVRYTRWRSPNFTQSLIDTFVGGRNQAQVLVGFTF